MDSHPRKEERGYNIGPWSLVEPFLLVSNRLIEAAETLSDLALTTAARLLSGEWPDGHAPATPPVAPAEKISSPVAHKPEPFDVGRSLPEIPPSPELHILPCGAGQVFIWYNLPQGHSEQPLILRELDGRAGAETRRVTLDPLRQSLYLTLPAGGGVHWIQIGHDRDGEFQGISAAAELRAPTCEASRNEDAQNRTMSYA